MRRHRCTAAVRGGTGASPILPARSRCTRDGGGLPTARGQAWGFRAAFVVAVPVPPDVFLARHARALVAGRLVRRRGGYSGGPARTDPGGMGGDGRFAGASHGGQGCCDGVYSALERMATWSEVPWFHCGRGRSPRLEAWARSVRRVAVFWRPRLACHLARFGVGGVWSAWGWGAGQRQFVCGDGGWRLVVYVRGLLIRGRQCVVGDRARPGRRTAPGSEGVAAPRERREGWTLGVYVSGAHFTSAYLTSGSLW